MTLLAPASLFTTALLPRVPCQVHSASRLTSTATVVRPAAFRNFAEMQEQEGVDKNDKNDKNDYNDDKIEWRCLMTFSESEYVELKSEVVGDLCKEIIAVTVQKGTDRPYYLGSKGLKPSGVYVRSGTVSDPATDTAIRKMIKETDGDCFENMRFLEQNLTFESANAQTL